MSAAERSGAGAAAGQGAPVVVDAGPFDLGRGDDAALCLHGLTGTPYEVRPLAEALAGAGIRAVGPRLPGHGAGARTLAAARLGEWLEAVRAAHLGLVAQHRRVSVVGLSLGGLLALALAAERPVDALVVMGTPLHLRSRLRRLLPVVRHARLILTKRGGSDIQDAAARARHPSLPVMPVASIHELVRLQHRVRARLARVSAPLLVAHGRLDRTAHPDDAREILRAVASPERELRWLPNSGHVLPVDHDASELARAAIEFLSRSRASLR